MTTTLSHFVDSQAEFSVVSYSFGLKLLWAPIVDCVYSRTLGRRKTWLIPTQYLLGTCVEQLRGDHFPSGQYPYSIGMMVIVHFHRSDAAAHINECGFLVGQRRRYSRAPYALPGRRLLRRRLPVRDARYCRRWLGVDDAKKVCTRLYIITPSTQKNVRSAGRPFQFNSWTSSAP